MRPTRPRAVLLAIALSVVAATSALLAAPAGAAVPRQQTIPVPQALPLGIDGDRTGVHPGAIVQTDIGLCTMNFLFADGSGNRYIATAGHCVLEGPEVGGADLGEHTWPPGAGPVAKDADGNVIGRFVYAVREDSQERDFSLIRLDPGVSAGAALPHFGGPTGIDTSTGSDPVLLEHFGNGVLVGDLLPARSALALGTPDPDHVFAEGVIAPGDSGSAIETAGGEAVGVIVTFGLHLGALGTGGLDAGTMGITRLAPQLAMAERALGVKLALQTAPLA